MPKRAYEPRVIQSSKLVCRKAYLIRKTRLPESELAVLVSRVMSGVTRNATMCEMLPLTLI
jgi:hypothetical protein